MAKANFQPDFRQHIIAALPADTAIHGAAAPLSETYLPAGHARALQVDVPLVVGGRGAGKSFWWAALQSPDHCRYLGQVNPTTGLSAASLCSPGFGTTKNIEAYPPKDTLVQLAQEFEPRFIWKTVICKAISPHTLGSDLASWRQKVEWVRANPEPVDHALEDADRELHAENRSHLVLFDALDRSADDWPTVNRLVRGLLQNLLDLRSFRRIKAKVFLRADQLDLQKVADFPDASKLLAMRVDLKWSVRDLYNLVFHLLANATDKDGGRTFRTHSAAEFGPRWAQIQSIWAVPATLRMNDTLQRDLFHAISGPWMGRDRRKGFPYTWVPNHLGDTNQQVSPRSFLAALRKAAEETADRSPPSPTALHYEGIKAGVQRASEIRVSEVREDYPWIDELLKPLASLAVPAEEAEFWKRWADQGVLEGLKTRQVLGEVKLPPAHLDNGAAGVVQDLEALGLVERLRDRRLNMPDVYRVGYRLVRRGGVKPLGR